MKNCSICGSNALTAVYADEEFDVYRCLSCGALLSAYEAPDLAKEYDAAYFRHFEGRYKQFRLRQYRRLLTALSEASPGRRLLDVGCALGYFVEEAQRNGWDAAGIDISDAAIAYATRERHVPGLVCSRFEDYSASPEGFHTITFLDVLEHLRQPHEALRRARHLLVDDGILV
ncbi:MAG: class I SAM-dependent methyltransferase, partial [Dehalococcoidia bacterium]